jgi:hypothetical protein
VQGQTCDRVDVDLGNTEFARGLTFVALSRVRALNHLRIRAFPESRFLNMRNRQDAVALWDELIRLQNLTINTRILLREEGLLPEDLADEIPALERELEEMVGELEPENSNGVAINPPICPTTLTTTTRTATSLGGSQLRPVSLSPSSRGGAPAMMVEQPGAMSTGQSASVMSAGQVISPSPTTTLGSVRSGGHVVSPRSPPALASSPCRHPRTLLNSRNAADRISNEINPVNSVMINPAVTLWYGHSMDQFPPTNIGISGVARATHSWIFMPIILGALLGVDAIFTAMPKPIWLRHVIERYRRLFHRLGVTLESLTQYFDGQNHFHALVQEQLMHMDITAHAHVAEHVNAMFHAEAGVPDTINNLPLDPPDTEVQHATMMWGQNGAVFHEAVVSSRHVHMRQRRAQR